MADIQTEEGWHTVADGTKLYTKTWKVFNPTIILLLDLQLTFPAS